MRPLSQRIRLGLLAACLAAAAACARLEVPPLVTPFVPPSPVPALAQTVGPAAPLPTERATLPSASATATPELPESTPALTATAAGGTPYTVVSGDTFWGIAVSFGVTPESLMDANPQLDPDVLYPGDVILVPDPNRLADLPVPDARVRLGGGGLDLLSAPDLGGSPLAELRALTRLEVVGRTADDAWLQVVTPAQETGWVTSAWLEVSITLAEVPVSWAAPTWVPTSAVVAATPTVVVAPPAGRADYNVLSGLTTHALEIFRQGQDLGNRPNVFSKVGDSITLSPAFLSPIGLGSYNLYDFAGLQPVIDYYATTPARAGANSFANTSLAAKVGWRARAVFSPNSADPVFCSPGETPLACEYRLVKPAVALIMLGTNDVPYTPVDEFESDLGQIVQLTLDRGIIPVLSTIPNLYRTGLEGRAELLNGVIVKVAQDYEVPLWDYYQALSGLPRQGLGGDGVHPTWAPSGRNADFTPENLQYGMVVRNLTALYVLDDIWRQIIQP